MQPDAADRTAARLARLAAALHPLVFPELTDRPDAPDERMRERLRILLSDVE